MNLKIKSKNIVLPSGLFDGYIGIENGRIAGISEKDFPADRFWDFGDLYVSAGFIDIHNHGGGGFAFADSSSEEILKGCEFHLRHGTTSILPTVSAGRFEAMRASVANIAAAMRSGKAKTNILGAHLEGPYLSAKQCGAQCPDFITLPIEKDYKSLINDYGKYIARWTYAPENDEKGEFCRYLTKHGILASAGHSEADYRNMRIAQENGCRLVTHLYSCTSTVTRQNGFRRLGIIESAFLSDDLYVEIIADGKHLPPELIKMIVKIKGIGHTALVTDCLSVAGTDKSEGEMCGTEYIIEDGVCKLKNRTAFAGSIATADRLLRVLIRDCGADIVSAVKMLTETPAGILSLPEKGKLKIGCDADLAVFDENIDVKAVFVNGETVEF